MSESQPTWLSLHLDLAGPVLPADQIYGATADRVLAGLVEPLVQQLTREGLLSGFFFIRYRDPDPHVRVRLLAPGIAHRDIVSASEAARIEFNRTNQGRGSVSRLRLEPYRPEVERYGGPGGVRISERLFETSSRLVLNLLPALLRANGDIELRLGHGVLSISILLGSLLAQVSEHHVRRFLDGYEGGLLSFRISPEARNEVAHRFELMAGEQDRLVRTARAVLDRAARPDLLPYPFSEAAQGFGETRAALEEEWRTRGLRAQSRRVQSFSEGIEFLTSSYLHMHLNRLGVAPLHEALLCRIVRKSLESTPAPVS